MSEFIIVAEGDLGGGYTYPGGSPESDWDGDRHVPTVGWVATYLPGGAPPGGPVLYDPATTQKVLEITSVTAAVGDLLDPQWASDGDPIHCKMGKDITVNASVTNLVGETILVKVSRADVPDELTFIDVDGAGLVSKVFNFPRSGKYKITKKFMNEDLAEPNFFILEELIINVYM